ncbi:glycoside hydrolase family 127 protein [Luteolibacter pohnpeiensis]|uniref:Glycoside hydrolase family 127 protein n=1 Tax=Luteolibacter pohnpeiensis TaxID=454153 RepID=A0A934VUB9_9BACT|nr:beta-L-arabinofuranosidase domain-containing protein [Luteolibacter pohnpeiensis]MBK1882367.1 glycoside hydrolase family 127 protein [Luteolibacter pohnpeiensis]
MKLSTFFPALFFSGVIPTASAAEPTYNRAPLQPIPYTALPLGSVKPAGWLRTQLELQRDGLTGHAEELLPAVNFDSAWRGGNGENWEKGPYYLKGLIPLAWGLDDETLKKAAKDWIDPILSSQRPDGFYGPENNTDWWPRMVVNYLLRDYQEATGDPRIEPFLSKYYAYMSSHLDADPLKDWGMSRAGDDIDNIFWLYNRTGEKKLLTLAKKLSQQAYPWTEIFEQNKFLQYDSYQPRHGVNIPQALKMPAVYSQLSKNEEDRKAFQQGVAHLMKDHGLSVGINSGTEFLAGSSTTEGIELCSIVERMLSDATAARILGDCSIADHLELMAFNALPGSLSSNIHQHVYFCVPNNVIAKHGGVGYAQDYDNANNPGPISGFPCCCYNFHMGWPKLLQNSWAATSDGGLAPLVYVPSTVTTTLKSGHQVTIREETGYPFKDTIRFSFDLTDSVRFPLTLRVPGWCKEPTITLNGAGMKFSKIIQREWKPGDVLELKLPMPLDAVPGINQTVSIRRGPLIYSLAIQEDWESTHHAAIAGFDSYDVLPEKPWNYALQLDPKNLSESIQITETDLPENPYQSGAAPVKLSMHARRLPSWKLAANGLVATDPPMSPVSSEEPLETVTLVPFGSQMLRVTSFPVLGNPSAPAKSFSDDFADGDYEGWLTYGTGWFVKEGKLQPAVNANTNSAGAFGVKAIVPATDFSDLDYEASVAVGPIGDAGLMFRVRNASLGADSYDGYYVGISAEKQRVVLGKAVNQRWVEITSKAFKITPSTSYQLRIKASGSHLEVFLLDQKILNATDDSYQSGCIGVREYTPDPAKTIATFTSVQAKAD